MGGLGTACSPNDIEEKRLSAPASVSAESGREPQFARIATLAASMFEVPVALITLFEDGRLSIKARAGISCDEIPGLTAFCPYSAQSREPSCVPNMAADERFSSHPLVVGPPYVRFCASAPLTAADDHSLGSICIIDTRPRHDIDRTKMQMLAELANLLVSEIRQQKDFLVQSNVLNFADATKLSLVTVDETGRIEFVNRAMTDLFGYDREEMVGQPIDIIIPEPMRGAHRAGLARVVAGGETALSEKTIEVLALKKDGSEFPIDIALSVWRAEQGVTIGAIIRDISQARERDARLMRLAHHDPLTGLCNRFRFEGQLSELFEKAAAVAVLLIDLDGFKEVNDNFGHAAGDALLQSLGIRLATVTPAHATLARFGGDEFAILVPGMSDPLAAQLLASDVISALELPFEVNQELFYVGASVGYAFGSSNGSDAEEVIASADVALYRAKQNGGRCIRMFSPDMRGEAISRRAVIDDLRRAFRLNELELHYQPQVSLENGEIFGVEALLRWRHPQKGLLFPGAFLAALETSSLALPIGWWILDEACRQLAEWQREGIAGLKVGVNLFAAQFRSPSLVQHVRRALEKYGLKPSMLELEVTETIALLDDGNSFSAMRDLRTLGIDIAFDDFGTGFASLSSLQRFPLTTLKIDRSFVSDILTKPQDAAIVRAIVSMGNELGLHTIAEGVETAEQEAFLKRLQCKAVQGYRYGRPEPAATFAALAAGRPRMSPYK
jgi:diguanylate cyclase (GGDEF)-like protein/PAS domain S-box-containing protein